MFNHGANQWPAQRPNFRPVMQAYLNVMLDLAARMMGGIALSLDLPEEYFAGFCRDADGDACGCCIIRRSLRAHGPGRREQAPTPISAA